MSGFITPGKYLVGTCSICGGHVTAHNVWMSTQPDVPRCERCGATAAPSGPVIPMTPSGIGGPWRSVTTDSTGGAA
jgi:hypothetical protein